MISLPAVSEFWRHYKGSVYSIVCLAHDENSGVPVVVYRNAKWSDDYEAWIDNPEASTWVRPLHQWYELVEDGNGCRLLRFTRINMHER